MSERERILLSVDESDASRQAIDYVGRVAAASGIFSIHLYHRLPGLPPELREHGFARSAAREDELARELAARVEAWRAKLQRSLGPLLEASRQSLTKHGVDEQTIHNAPTWDASPGESLAEAMLRVARAEGCGTVALAREHSHGLHALLHPRTADEAVRKGDGLTLWIIE